MYTHASWLATAPSAQTFSHIPHWCSYHRKCMHPCVRSAKALHYMHLFFRAIADVTLPHVWLRSLQCERAWIPARMMLLLLVHAMKHHTTLFRAVPQDANCTLPYMYECLNRVTYVVLILNVFCVLMDFERGHGQALSVPPRMSRA